MKENNMIKKFIESHKFFVKESRTFVGVEKKDYSISYPIFGEVVEYTKKPFSVENKTIGIIGVEHPTNTVYKLKDLIYYPIAYTKFMYLCLKDFYKW